MIVCKLKGQKYAECIGGAYLKDASGKTVGSFKTADQVKKYLQNNPDQDYQLEPPANLTRLLQSEPDPNVSVCCGRVRFDSKTGTVENDPVEY
jgi:hypothetical protein